MAPKLSPSRFTGGMQPPAPKGPFFIFLLMMPAFFVVIAMLLVAMEYKQLHAFVSDKPMVSAAVPESKEAQERIYAKVRDFFAADSADTLFLGAEDVNHLTRTSQALVNQHLDYRFDLRDTVLVARSSLPVSSLRGSLAFMSKLLRIRGYLNSEMTGFPELADGKLTMVPVGGVINGMPAPVSVLNQNGPVDIRNLVADQDFYDKALGELAGVKVRQGRLMLIKKHRS